MAQEQRTQIHAQIRALFNVGVSTGTTDGQLLERFATRRGEAAELAFAMLVERHAPMVFHTCMGILRDDHDAMDAFQATFLVLVRKGSSLWVEDSLGPWLHRVACRIAVRAKVAAVRRRGAERRAAQRASECPEHDGQEALRGALHEEINRLPGQYRVPVVLYDLEGRTYEETARAIGCPVGTVKSRLARGRQRLRERLTARGLALSAGLLTSNVAEAAVPVPLSELVVQAALRVGAVPASVTTVMSGVLRMMFLEKLTKRAAVVLATGALTVTMGVLIERTAGAPPRDVGTGAAPKTVLAATKVEKRTGEVIARVVNLSRDDQDSRLVHTVAIDPVTAEWRTIAKNLPPGPISPDGRYVVYSQLGRDHDDAELGIWVYDTTGEAPPRRVFEQNGEPHWSDNGQRIVIGVPRGAKYETFETWRVNADGTGRTKLPIPETDLVLDSSRDGTWLATRTLSGDPAHQGRFTLVHPDGTGARVLTEGSAQNDVFTIFRISPDGRRVAYVEVKTQTGGRTCRLFVMDIEDRYRRELPVTFEPDTTVTATWSPDGSRLALNLMNGRTKEGAVALIDTDGKNFRKLPLPRGQWNIHVCGWEALAPELQVGDVDKLTPVDPKTPHSRFVALLEEVKNTKPFEARLHVGRFLELAESAPEDRAAVDAWIWIVTFGFDGPEYWRAIDRLASHATTGKVGHAALNVTGSPSPSAQKLLRAVIAQNDNHQVKGLACLALGRYLKNQSERLRAIKDDPNTVKQWEGIFLGQGSTVEGFARFLAQDPDALIKESETVLERTDKEFGDVPHDRGRTLGDEARAELDEIHNLCVGKPAPEIVGEDVDGTPIRLSAFRGKVTLVSFWADWCASCRAMFDDENALVARMKGRPFVLLGVNGDGERDKVKALIKKAGITWRSCWDGGGSANDVGPIARRYNVRVWPTLYVLDHNGVIRHKFVGTPGANRLNSAIDALVKAAEGSVGNP